MKINLKKQTFVTNVNYAEFNQWYQGKIQYSGLDEDVLYTRLNGEYSLILFQDGDMELCKNCDINKGSISIFPVDVEINVS